MPTLTSSTGGADSETRIVSPMPLAQQGAEGDRGLDRALERRARLGDAEVQRVVAGLAEQLVRPHHDHRVVVLDTDLEVAEAVLLEQARLPQRRLDQRLGRRLAVLGQQPLVQRAGVDADPDRGAAVAGRPRRSPCTWSSKARMLPGLTRTAAQPASIAANTYFGWKWMSAITGICDLCAIAGSASASSWLGTATRTMSQPVAVSSAICCSVALMSEVSVVVIDCTLIGASPPTATLPTWICRVLRRGGQGRWGQRRACRGRCSWVLSESRFGGVCVTVPPDPSLAVGRQRNCGQSTPILLRLGDVVCRQLVSGRRLRRAGSGR